MTKLLIFGPPGSGKGTTAKHFAKYISIEHISSGDLFRDEIAAATELGKKVSVLITQGKLVDDVTTTKLVLHQLEQHENFILDGYPRTHRQATDLLSAHHINGIIQVELADDKIVHRIAQRRMCPRDGSTYHLLFKPPKNEGICDRCHAKLVQRSDDTESTVRDRLTAYKQTTAPALTWLKAQGIPVITIPGDYDLRTEGEALMRKILAWQKVVESQ
jgi:adenylate kinase